MNERDAAAAAGSPLSESELYNLYVYADAFRHHRTMEFETEQIARVACDLKRLRATSLKLCRELQCPAMEYLNKGIRDAWTELSDIVDPPTSPLPPPGPAR